MNGHAPGLARHPPLWGCVVMTRDVNAQNVWTVADVCDEAMSTLVGRRVRSRIWKSCLLSVMSASSADFPEHESLNSDTHVAGDTFESPKFVRNRIDRSASSFGELFTCTLIVLDAVFVSGCPALV